MPLDPEVLRARIALRIARLEVECARLARDIAAEQAEASIQAHLKRAARIATQLRSPRMRPLFRLPPPSKPRE
jgi:hypothetical protein